MFSGLYGDLPKAKDEEGGKGGIETPSAADGAPLQAPTAAWGSKGLTAPQSLKRPGGTAPAQLLLSACCLRSSS